MKNPENVRRGRNSKARGKSVERMVAKLVGGKRIPDGNGYGDVLTEDDIFEVKSRQSPTPQWLLKAWGQATDSAAVTETRPNVVLSTVDGRKRRFWRITEITE